MSPLVSLLVGVASAALAAFATVFQYRRTAPSQQAQMLTASTVFLQQLQHRIQLLEDRVAVLETENDLYHMLYGPFPVPDPKDK